ncbi:MAG: DUF2130 domain-containing protein [Pseudomonadota bacterium]
MEPKIDCPQCGHQIELTESLAGPLLADLRREHGEALKLAEAEKAAALDAQRAQIEAKALEAAQAQQSAALAKLKADQEAERAQAAEALALEKARGDAAQERLEKAREAEKAALAKEQALKDREADLDIEIARKLSQERSAQTEKLRAQITAQMAEAEAEAKEAQEMKLREKDEQMETLKRQIEVLKQKSEKGSQQLQGEVLEVAIEERLALAFPADVITPVGKGVRGADCLQAVAGAGEIIWETKRTQNWSKDWPGKLKEDQRREGAEAAVLVSTVLPEGIETFGEHDGIWVTAPRFAVGLASALRQGLIATAQAAARREGQAQKTELLYDYLTVTGFRQRVEALAETYEAMMKSLTQERAAMTRIWDARTKQITRMMDATAGMYGDIQGIAGAALPGIDALELPGPEGE